MKMLVTGGTGFIGSRLAISGLERGHEVTVLGQTNTPAEESNLKFLQKQGIKLALGSVTEREKVFEAVRDQDLVFHLAAAQHEANVPDQHFLDINVEGTRNMLDAAVEAGVKRFVHGSTIGVYGSAMEGELDEESTVRPANIYGKTKLEGEKLVLSYADSLPLTVIRISETYGPGDRRLLKLFKAINKGAFFMIGKGENKHQLIYVDDLIDGMFSAAERNEALGEVLVLTGEEVLSTNDMVAAVAKAMGIKPPSLKVPLWPFMVAAFILEKTLRPLGIQPPLHRRRLDFFRKSFFFRQDKSRKLIDFQPQTTFKQGAAHTAQWYREQGLL